MASIDHYLSDTDRHVHDVWDNALDPVLWIESGDIVQFECRDAWDGQIDQHATLSTVLNGPPRRGHPITGPVGIEGAEPGDGLEIELLELVHHGWGWTLFPPGDWGRGLLPEEFSEPALHYWTLEDDIGHFVHGIEVPLAPFPGIVGVAPAEGGEHSTTPPRRVGGNLDIKQLTEGSTLLLPIETPGALLSIGDGHAAQGDGEVCVSAIESPLTITARLTLHRGVDLSGPELRTVVPPSQGSDRTIYGTCGVADDLMTAAKKAILAMVSHLHDEHDLTRSEAYLLCSVAVDLRINELVNTPNWVVSAFLPERVFP